MSIVRRDAFHPSTKSREDEEIPRVGRETLRSRGQPERLVALVRSVVVGPDEVRDERGIVRERGDGEAPSCEVDDLVAD